MGLLHGEQLVQERQRTSGPELALHAARVLAAHVAARPGRVRPARLTENAMQPRPTAEEILRDVAALLDDVLVPALSGPAQHQARVAASLVGIVHREVQFSAGNDAAERDAWTGLLGDAAPPDADLLSLRQAAADAL